MATYYSDLCQPDMKVQRKYEINRDISAVATYTLTGALALNDVIQMVPVQKGATIVGGWLSATDLDTNGTPTIVLDVGDTDATDDTDRYIDGSTVAQTGAAAVSVFDRRTGLGYKFAEDGTIDVLVQAGPATAATTGTITLRVEWTQDAT